MISVLLNNEMEFNYPESFHVMSDEELAGVGFSDIPPALCITDPDLHMVITTAWVQINGLLSKLVGTEKLAKKMEARTSAPMKPFGYRRGGFLNRSVGGNKGSGFTFSYTAQDTNMNGESIVVKVGNVFYYLHRYCRADFEPQSAAVWEDILNAVRWR